MNETQRRAWHALALGPRWVMRQPPVVSAPVHVDPAAAESACPAFGHAWSRAALQPPGSAQVCLAVLAPADSGLHAPATQAEPVAVLWQQMLAAAGIDPAAVVLLKGLPTAAGMASDSACSASWRSQLEQLAPCVVVALGEKAAQAVLGTAQPWTAWRGQIQALATAAGPLSVAVMDDPADLLGQPGLKATAWREWCEVRVVYGACGRGMGLRLGQSR